MIEALRLAWAKGPRVIVAAALEELGVQAVQQGDTRHGVYLLSMAATLRQSMGTPVRVVDRPAVSGALAAARTTLGAAGFRSIWATAQTQSIEQVVARVVAGSDDLTPASDDAVGDEGPSHGVPASA